MLFPLLKTYSTEDSVKTTPAGRKAWGLFTNIAFMNKTGKTPIDEVYPGQ